MLFDSALDPLKKSVEETVALATIAVPSQHYVDKEGTYINVWPAR